MIRKRILQIRLDSRPGSIELNNEVIRPHGNISQNEVTDTKEVVVHPPKYFDPYGGENLLCDETYSIHHYAASWTSEPNRFKRRLHG